MQFYPKDPKSVKYAEIPGSGQVNVEVTVIDDTEFIKDEKIREKYLTQKMSWSIIK